MHVHALGDQALMVYLPDEGSALAFAQSVRGQAWPWLIDVVQAYRSVAVFYDPLSQGPDEVRGMLLALDAPAFLAEKGRLHVIPCCYALGLDLERVARFTGLNVEEVVAAHTSTEYTVYAIGFCPGFPYLGYLPETLSGVPRLESPRLRVEAGSVGLTGKQTGIYTEARPGGWNIVGRTPLQLVNVADGYFPIRTGDRVRFEAIDPAEYAARLGEREK